MLFLIWPPGGAREPPLVPKLGWESKGRTPVALETENAPAAGRGVGMGEKRTGECFGLFELE